MYVCVCVFFCECLCIGVFLHAHVHMSPLVGAQYKKHALEYLYFLISISERASA